jgi:hypothetical protein
MLVNGRIHRQSVARTPFQTVSLGTWVNAAQLERFGRSESKVVF